MRWFRNIIMAISLVLLVGACQRRPFAESRTKVALNLIIKTDIVNHTQTDLPENMRVDLYDPQTGQIRYTDYVGPHGGYIYPSPGVYDMIVYSIGSESTIVHKTQNINTIEVYTNEVSSFVKGQIAQFLAKRSQVAKDRLAKKYAALMQGGEPIEKAPQLNEDELVVNQPDHIFVGRYHNLEVPVIYEHDEIIPLCS